jgi:hypothetical protein
MSDLDGILSAITVENIQTGTRMTFTASGSTTFTRDATIPVWATEPADWTPVVQTVDTPLPAWTPRQIQGAAFSMELQGWKVIGYAHHGMPNAGIVQR